MENNIPVFVESILPETEYRNVKLINSPVNISLCQCVKLRQVNWYPDNKGIPALFFQGCNTTWHYNCYDAESKRQEDYDRIMKKFGMKGIK